MCSPTAWGRGWCWSAHAQLWPASLTTCCRSCFIAISALHRSGLAQVVPGHQAGAGRAVGDPGRLPELFQERVQASTVVQSVVDGTRGQVQIVGRRSLGEESALHWYAVPSGGADLEDPATRDAVVAETDRLAAEYF